MYSNEKIGSENQVISDLIWQLQIEVLSFTRTWSSGYIQVLCAPLCFLIEYMWFSQYFYYLFIYLLLRAKS